MRPRFKKKRSLRRTDKPLRDARIFVIATEDTYVPKAYFELFQNSRVCIRVLETQDGHSAPTYVLERLKEVKNSEEFESDDQFWLVLDTDHWIAPGHIDSFKRVCRDASDQGFKLAHSNPCFEFWLLLHHEEVAENTRYEACGDVVERLKELLSGYSKRTIPVALFTRNYIETAVKRAKKLDESSTGDRWPHEKGTHVYKLVEQLLDK